VADWVVEKIDRKRHDCADFDCGKPSLNNWLRHHAGQHERSDLARTYVLVRPGQVRVLGYYAISNCEIRHETLPDSHARKIPKHLVIPGVLLGRLAVDVSVQGQRLGNALLMNALRRLATMADEIAIKAVTVHALDDDAIAFYRHKGFEGFLDDPRHLFMPMSVVRRLVNPS
jgi:GNAT superfamily N-acetyltransferase